MYVLEIMSGPLDGKTWTFDGEITIGRDDRVATACITIDRYVSRRHARLWETEGELRLADLSSRNGTRLAGEPVTGETPLTLGQQFVVGRTQLRVRKA
jgi:pSer/pThr/pTyr-binding forkhead associated (FHA) protein